MKAQALLFFGLVACALCACEARSNPHLPPKPPDTEVWIPREQASLLHLEVIQEQDLADTLLVGGKIAFDDLRVSHVFSPVNGRVTQVLAQPGQRVTAGTPLVTIASPDVGATFSDLVKAQADYEAAEHDYNRQQELFQAHAGAKKDLETAEDNFKKSSAELQRAKQKAKLLRSGSVDRISQEYTLRAPIAGEVVARNVNPGVEVQGQYSGGQAVELFTIGELDQVFVYADVHELELAHVHQGTEVKVQVVSYPNKTFTGYVDLVSAVLDSTTRTAKVRCSIKNPDQLLKPEMYATVAISISKGRHVALPRSALVHLGEQTFVFVAKGQVDSAQANTADERFKFERRPVGVDEDISSDFYPVLRGLQAGETIVVDGALLLSQVS
jgi:membrane fusion protein, heavy metal efflux system